MVEHVCDMVICPVHFKSVVNNFDKSKVFSHKKHIKIAKLLKLPTIPSGFIKTFAALCAAVFPRMRGKEAVQNHGRIYFP